MSLFTGSNFTLSIPVIIMPHHCGNFQYTKQKNTEINFWIFSRKDGKGSQRGRKVVVWYIPHYLTISELSKIFEGLKKGYRTKVLRALRSLANQNYFEKICELLESGEVLAVECIFGELLQRVKNKNELDKKLLRVLPDERKKKKEKWKKKIFVCNFSEVATGLIYEQRFFSFFTFLLLPVFPDYIFRRFTAF